MEALGVAATFAAILAYIWARQYLQVQKRQQERALLHKERMLAMEKGIPLPELPSLEEEPSGSVLDQMSNSVSNVLPKLPLGCGLILMALGLGILTAFNIAPDPELRNVWSVGFIPLFLGVGFILYYLFTRRT